VGVGVEVQTVNVLDSDCAGAPDSAAGFGAGAASGGDSRRGSEAGCGAGRSKLAWADRGSAGGGVEAARASSDESVRVSRLGLDSFAPPVD